MTPREDDTTSTPPHGDPLHERPARDGASASRHGVPHDPRGAPADAGRALGDSDHVPSTPRPAPSRDDTP